MVLQVRNKLNSTENIKLRDNEVSDEDFTIIFWQKLNEWRQKFVMNWKKILELWRVKKLMEENKIIRINKLLYKIKELISIYELYVFC